MSEKRHWFTQQFLDTLDPEIPFELFKMFMTVDHAHVATHLLVTILWMAVFVASLSGMLFSYFLTISHADYA